MKNISVIFENNHYGINEYNDFVNKYPKINNNKTLVLLKRNQELLFTILMLFNDKNTFIPIDPTYPTERIQYIADDSKADYLINNTDINLIISNNENNKIESPKKTAYILYTSGSTGQPKGVAISRDSLFNFIDGISEIIDFTPGKRIACLTTVSFDIFFLESIMALYKGLTVVLANDDEQRNPKLMAKLIIENRVDMVQMTPSRMQLLMNHDKELLCLKNVKEIMIGGEPFPLNLLQSLQEKTNAKIYNMYGPTETTIWSTVSDLTYKNNIDIGRAIKNTQVYIVDENLNVLPNGEAGEICIAGNGLALGYVNRGDLTAEKFIYLPQNPNIKIYRTGDFGKYTENNSLEYLGRVDNQVKIRGYRIELEEIETCLNQYEGIKQSVVITFETSENNKALQAFYTSESNINPNDIKDYLSKKLPSYMIPDIFKRVESFIQTINGKIDRKKIAECIEIKIDHDTSQETEINTLNDVQKRAFEIIISNISERIPDNISLDTDFNSTGSNSITFITTIVALESEFDFEFDDEMLLITKFPTIKSMVEYVELKTKAI